MRGETRRPESAEMPTVPLTAEAEAASVLSVNDVLQSLLRHKWFIGGWVIFCTAIAVTYVILATPIYEASASIRIDPTRAGSLGLNDLIAGGGVVDSGELIATELAIVKSDAVAIDTLDSLSEEDFQKLTGSPKSKLHIPVGSTSLTRAQEGVLAGLKGSLRATQLQGTQLVVVTFRSTDPQLAAVITNHFIGAYLRQSFDSRYGSVAQVTRWLSTEMDSLKERAAEAQRKLSRFQEQNNILGTETGSSTAGGPANNTTTDRLRLINDRLTQATQERIVKEAQLRAANTGSPAVLASLYPTSELTSLLGEQARLYAQLAQLSAKFGDNYPPLIDLKSEMKTIDTGVERETATVLGRLRQEYDAALATEKMLQTQFDEQAQQAYALNRQQAEYAVLKAEGTSSSELYNTLQYKLQQAGVDAGLNAVNTMMVDSARAPLIPVEPKKATLISFGVLLGFFAGIGAALLKEATADTVQRGDQLERILGYHQLAVIPRISFEEATGVSPAAGKGISTGVVTDEKQRMLVAYNSPLSVGADAYRTLRNSVLLALIDSPVKTVLITSSLPGEGKSSTTSNYAVVLAQKGARVLAVDADLRRPTLHERFGIENTVGLSDLILGEDIPNPIQQPLPGLETLFVLPSGKKIPLPSEALGSMKFHDLLKGWESEYDYVILDSAPLLAVSDSLMLASWVDALILVTLFNRTPIGAVRRTRGILNQAKARVAGTIINAMPGNLSGYYGYGGYGYGGYGYGGYGDGKDYHKQ